MRCSVVVPTCDRPVLLARTLNALAAQTLAPDEYEIIVCDDGASDATRSVVEQCREASTVSITYVPGSPPKQGPSAMRNAGLKISRGEIIAFTDDDARPDPDWLRQGLLALEVDDADAASGRIVVPLPDEAASYERDAAWVERAGFVTSNWFCRRWVLDCVGGFDARIRAPWHEGSGLLFTLLDAGFDVVHATDAVVILPVRRRPLAERVESIVALVMRAFISFGVRRRPLQSLPSVRAESRG